MPLASDEHIGSRVRIARNAAGLTQVQLGDFLGRTESWVANVESGRQPLDRYSVIAAIADQCDVDVAWLLGQPYRLQRKGGVDRPCACAGAPYGASQGRAHSVRPPRVRAARGTGGSGDLGGADPQRVHCTAGGESPQGRDLASSAGRGPEHGGARRR
ncbi:helix-turn-helix domain-containing protein [Streptomyces bacillaris]|uniref:helix-turn-helix domain-containing protein n=1 Tax=Streptomyces bacillaris TaxID=68179 RepID=UPI0037002BCD